MCLAIPVKISSIEGTLAQVEIGGNRIQVSIELTPEAVVGSYVLQHAGYAISVLDEEEALETLSMLGEIARMGEEEG